MARLLPITRAASVVRSDSAAGGLAALNLDTLGLQAAEHVVKRSLHLILHIPETPERCQSHDHHLLRPP